MELEEETIFFKPNSFLFPLQNSFINKSKIKA